MSIRIGILGYGNLGRGVECAIKHNPDTELVAVFTRRDPKTVKILTETATVYSVNDAEKMKDKIDVLIICGGSATDLPVQTPEYAKLFNVVDSFDTHARIPEHFANVDKAAKEGNRNAVVFPRARVEGAPYDFSFSGLKSAVLNQLNLSKMKGEEINPADVAASFQNCVVDTLVTRAMHALEETGMKKGRPVGRPFIWPVNRSCSASGSWRSCDERPCSCAERP